MPINQTRNPKNDEKNELRDYAVNSILADFMVDKDLIAEVVADNIELICLAYSMDVNISNTITRLLTNKAEKQVDQS